jgi:hypothetical protein
MWKREEARRREIEQRVAQSNGQLRLIAGPPEAAQALMPGALGRQTSTKKRETSKVTTQLRALLQQLDDDIDARATLMHDWDTVAESNGAEGRLHHDAPKAAAADRGGGIRAALRASSPAERSGIVQVALDAYRPVSEAVQANLASQADTLRQLAVAHEQFVQLQPPETELDRQRKAFFKQLSESCAEFLVLTEASTALIKCAAACAASRLMTDFTLGCLLTHVSN